MGFSGAAVIDSLFTGVGLTSYAYWFTGFSAMTEVAGFERLLGMADAIQVFRAKGSWRASALWASTQRHEEGGLGALLVQPPGERRGQVRAGGTSGASELKWTAGHADHPAKDSRTWPVGEVFDNGSSLSGSGAIRAGERWWRRVLRAQLERRAHSGNQGQCGVRCGGVRELLGLRLLGAYPRGWHERTLGRGADTACV